MRRWKEKLSKIKMPHTYVILTIILLVVVALCYLIPAGEYVRELDPVSGKTVVIPDSFHFTEALIHELFSCLSDSGIMPIQGRFPLKSRPSRGHQYTL